MMSRSGRQDGSDANVRLAQAPLVVAVWVGRSVEAEREAAVADPRRSLFNLLFRFAAVSAQPRVADAERADFDGVDEAHAELLRQDGKPYLLFSRSFTPSLHEKAALRAFLKQWMGRDLTTAEQNEFDTESLIGRPARVSVVHNEYNGTTYANIGLIRADKSGEPLKPSGKYTRQKDRQNNDERFRPASNSNESPTPSDWRRVKVHVGRHAGLDLGELDRQSVEALATKWLPTALEMEKPLKADRELIAALQQAMQALSADVEEDDIPF